MSTEQKSTRILARTFFEQLRSGGYSRNQVIGIAGELLELVTEDLQADRAAATEAPAGPEAPRPAIWSRAPRASPREGRRGSGQVPGS